MRKERKRKRKRERERDWAQEGGTANGVIPGHTSFALSPLDAWLQFPCLNLALTPIL